MQRLPSYTNPVLNMHSMSTTDGDIAKLNSTNWLQIKLSQVVFGCIRLNQQIMAVAFPNSLQINDTN